MSWGLCEGVGELKELKEFNELKVTK
jgi:hypothetical protein